MTMRDLIDLLEKATLGEPDTARPDTGDAKTRWMPNERRGQWTTSVRLSNGRTVGFALLAYLPNSDQATLQVNADQIIVGDKTFTRDGYDTVGRIVLGTLLTAARERVPERMYVTSANADLSKMLKQLLSRIGPTMAKVGYKTFADGIIRAE